jgi:hypothetical protein
MEIQGGFGRVYEQSVLEKLEGEHYRKLATFHLDEDIDVALLGPTIEFEAENSHGPNIFGTRPGFAMELIVYGILPYLHDSAALRNLELNQSAIVSRFTPEGELDRFTANADALLEYVADGYVFALDFSRHTYLHSVRKLGPDFTPLMTFYEPELTLTMFGKTKDIYTGRCFGKTKHNFFELSRNMDILDRVGDYLRDVKAVQQKTHSNEVFCINAGKYDWAEKTVTFDFLQQHTLLPNSLVLTLG